MKKGRIYFLRRADGLIKVGFTTDFGRRLAALTESHGPLEVLRVINGDRQREKKLHARLRKENQFGEWFRDCADIRRIIAEISDGASVDFATTDVEREWLAGEASMVEEACRLVERLAKARRDRFIIKNNAALEGLARDYGFRPWFLKRLHDGRPNTVSAFGMKKLREAYLAEITALRDQLLLEIHEAEQSSHDPETAKSEAARARK